MKLAKGLSEAMSGLYNAISEHLNGMKTAKSYGVEERHIEIFGRLAEQVRYMYTHGGSKPSRGKLLV